VNSDSIDVTMTSNLNDMLKIDISPEKLRTMNKKSRNLSLSPNQKDKAVKYTLQDSKSVYNQLRTYITESEDLRFEHMDKV